MMAIYILIAFLALAPVAEAALIELPAVSEARLEVIANSPSSLHLVWQQPDSASATRWVVLPSDVDISVASPDITIGESCSIGSLRLVPISVNTPSGDADISLSAAPDAAVWSRLPLNLRRTLSPFLLNRDDLRRDQAFENPATAYIYVYPDDDRVLESLEPLLAWRRLQGYQVTTLAASAGATPAEIRADIIAIHEETPVEYVCLVGDAGGDYAVPGFTNNTDDYSYSLLSGEDPIPEAAVGRLSFNSLAELEDIVAKILAYEKNPPTDDDSWLLHGAVSAGSRLSGLSTILVSRWVRDLMLDNGFAAVDTFWFTMGNDLSDFMTGAFDLGSAFVNYRGWSGIDGWNTRAACRLNNDRLPVALLLACNCGDYSGDGYGYTEALLRAPGGAIAAIGTAGSQSRVDYNNALMAGFYSGFFNDSLQNIGWSLVRAKLELFAAYDVLQLDRLSDHAAFTNLMGDPATIIWRGVPDSARIGLPDEAAIGPGSVAVQILNDADEPVYGARVSLYKENEIAATSYTDANGDATIPFDPLVASPGDASVTVCGDRIIPRTESLEMVASAHQLFFANYSVTNDEFPPHHGNGDGIANPNETIELFLTIQNIGAEAINGVVNFTLASDADVCEIRNGNFQFNGEIPAGGEVNPHFLMATLPDFPDREPVPFTLHAESGNEAWDMDFVISGEAPRWSFLGTSLDSPLFPGDLVWFDIFLANNGSLAAGAAAAQLESLSEYAVLVVSDGNYPPLDPDSQSGAGEIFAIDLDYAIPFGSDIPFLLHLASGDGYRASVHFTLPVAPLPSSEPTGPDAYGYWAIAADDLSNIAPLYDWMELNPDRNGSGYDTGLLDQSEDDDESAVLDLPFTFQYYSSRYRQLTVCTNGWAAFGDQSAYVDFRNMPIGAPQGPRAQLCPWWDDLYQPGADGAIFYAYDTTNHRFIVEWDHLRRYVGPAGPGAYETFELILLDPLWHPSVTGDGDVIFQYGGVINEARVDAHGTPYATVGIGNPDDTGGLEYGFWNRWAPGAAPIDSGSVIRFATAREHQYANVEGTVVAAATNAPIAGATVRVTPGGWTTTSDTGAFRIAGALANQPLLVSVFISGYNNATQALNPLNRGDTTTLEFRLTRPEIEVTPNSITDTLFQSRPTQHWFNIVNDGDGWLTYDISFDDPAHGLEPTWRRELTIYATDRTGDYRILGGAYIGNQFYVSGGNNGEEDKYFYLFNRYGNLNRQEPQPVQSLWGMRDLAYDGADIYGGSDDYIYRWNPDNGALDSIPSPLNPPLALAVDTTSGDFWVANGEEPIHRLYADGTVLRRYEHRLNIYGLAWRPDDPDGCPLYIFSNDGATHLAISKLDITRGFIHPVTELQLNAGDRPGGCELTTRYRGSRWSFIAVLQNPDGDRVEVLDAGVNTAFLSATPAHGVVLPGSRYPARLTINPADLDGGDHRLDMVIHHNAAEGELRIPILITYIVDAPAEPDASPADYRLDPVYPNPANGAGLVRYQLAGRSVVELTVWDQTGRRTATLFTGEMPAGEHTVAWELTNLPSGIYFLHLATPAATLTRKFVLLK